MDNFKFKKRFGQNFIKDKSVVSKIVEKTGIEDNSLIVEVGPGMGILTDELLKTGNKVISYEIDKTLSEYLNDKFKNNDNLELIFEDFIKRDISIDIKKYKFNKLYFIANVPYYITTPILMKLINLDIDFDKIVMMVQKEVGERYSAKETTKDYSSISVYLNYNYDIEKLFVVKKTEFIPQPKVDSIVISLTKKYEKLKLNDYNFFQQLVRDSFQFKRKTIKNNLKSYDLEKIEKILIKNSLSLSSRAEEIPLEVYVELSNYLTE